ARGRGARGPHLRCRYAGPEQDVHDPGERPPKGRLNARDSERGQTVSDRVRDRRERIHERAVGRPWTIRRPWARPSSACLRETALLVAKVVLTRGTFMGRAGIEPATLGLRGPCSAG